MSSSQEEIEAAIGAYAGQLFSTGMAGFEAITIGLGRRLGLYDALGDGVARTPGEVASLAGVHPRYAREWLEQQAAAGLIEVRASGDPETRSYSLSIAARECLLNPESLASLGPLLDAVVAIGATFPKIVDAYRTGGGIAFGEFGAHGCPFHEVQGSFNRPGLVNLLTSSWLPTVPGLAERLAADPPARVAELGCGEGWAAAAIAAAWPKVSVTGWDLDPPSIEAARRRVERDGLADRVRFEVADVSRDLRPSGDYDLVLSIETIHDLTRPRETLRAMRELARPDAVILVLDQKVGDAFEAPASNPYERFLYSVSVLHCLPMGMTESPSAATGTVMRPATLRGYALDAGFSAVEIIPIESDSFHCYRLLS